MSFLRSNLANILTVARLFLLPVIIALFYVEHIYGAWAAYGCFLIYALAAATDFFDGYIARKLNQISAFGTFLDPISDKVFVSTLLILLVAFERIGGGFILLVIVIFAREFLVSGLREFLGPKNVKVPVTRLAKWKTSVQMLALGFLILGPYAPFATEFGLIFLIMATILTVLTGFAYMMSGWVHLRASSIQQEMDFDDESI